MHTLFTKPVYIDYRLTDGSEFQITNLRYIETIAPFLVKFHLQNGDICAVPTVKLDYVGYGYMEDLDDGIHLPTTIFLLHRHR